MIEMNGAPTGLLVTEGHRDEIEMRRVHKEEIWDPTVPGARPRSPAAGPASRSPSGIDFEGDVLLAARRGRGAPRRAAPEGSSACESIAVMFLFSFVNPDHERRAARDHPRGVPRRRARLALARGDGPRARVRAGRRPRWSTPTSPHGSRTYVAKLAGQAPRGRLRGPAADHAVDRWRHAARVRRPPGRDAARLAARPAASWARRWPPTRAGVGDFVAVDMGGTSFDVCLVRGGRPEIKTDWNWRYRYYIGLPMVDVQSVGAGGGSIARVRQGALLVGPESAGSDARPGLLRPRRDQPDRHRRRRRARLPARRRVRRRAHEPRRRRGPRRDRARRRRPARPRRRSRPRGASSAS